MQQVDKNPQNPLAEPPCRIHLAWGRHSPYLVPLLVSTLHSVVFNWYPERLSTVHNFKWHNNQIRFAGAKCNTDLELDINNSGFLCNLFYGNLQKIQDSIAVAYSKWDLTSELYTTLMVYAKKSQQFFNLNPNIWEEFVPTELMILLKLI